MAFQPHDWLLLFCSLLVSFSTMLIQALAYQAISIEWHDWYAREVHPQFKKQRCLNQAIIAVLVLFSSFGLFALLEESHHGFLWNCAISLYLLLTLFDAVWPVPLWHWEFKRLSIMLLYVDVAIAYAFLACAALSSDSGPLSMVPVIPRAMWLTYVLVNEVHRVKPEVDDIEAKKEKAQLPLPHERQPSSVPPHPERRASEREEPPQRQEYPQTNARQHRPAGAQNLQQRLQLNSMQSCPIKFLDAADGWLYSTDRKDVLIYRDSRLIAREATILL